MNKCYKCGREFEGVFCPSCGTKYEATKICPNCGAELNSEVNFCNYCGHRFETYQNVNAKAGRDASKPSFLQKIKQKIGNVFSNVKSWIKTHKKASIGACAGAIAVVLVCVLVFAVIVPLATNIFSESRLSKINLGDTKEQVSKILGEPYGDTAKSNKWEYYSKDFVNLFKQQEAHDKKVDSITDFDKLEDLMKEELALEKKIENTKSGYIAVYFNNENKVTTVIYDAAYQITDAPTVSKKEVKKVTVGNNNILDVVDIANSNVRLETSYTDGSYKLAWLPSRVDVSNLGETNRNFPSSATLTWSDSWGEYSQNVAIDESNYSLEWSYSNGQLKISSILPSNTLSSFFQIDSYPWWQNNYEITSIYLDTNVASIPSLDELVQNPSILTKVEVSKDNQNFASLNGVLFNKEMTEVLYIPKSAKNIISDANGNLFRRTEERNPWYLFYSPSNSEELVLPYFNNGDYRISSDLSDKYTKLTFDNKFTAITRGLSLSELANIKEIVINDNITSIGDNAFSGIENLTTIIIGKNVTTIGNYAFSNCSKLQSIAIPASVTHIGYNIVYKCSVLKNIVVDENNSVYTSVGNCLIETTSKTLVAGCNNSEIPSDGSVTTIGSYSFSGCDGLTNLIIPNDITKILDTPFTECDNLISITIPESVVSTRTLTGSDALETVYWNAIACVNNGYNGVFNRCANLTTLVIGDNVTTLPNKIFYRCDSLDNIIIPDSVDSIPSELFNGCSGLTNVTIGGNVKSIGDSAFSGCSSLTNIAIPDDVTSIGSYAFSECSSLTNVTIPESVASIGKSAFQGCSSLTSIIIPDNVSSISAGLLSGCSSLESVTLPFIGDKIKTSSNTYQYPLGYIFGTNSYDGGIETKQDYYGSSTTGFTTLTTYYIPSTLATVTVNGGSILRGAFYNCSMVTSLILGENVINVEQYAFTGCNNIENAVVPMTAITAGLPKNNLKTIIITSGENIDRQSFYNCEKLVAIEICDGITTIGNYAFRGCSNLTSITIPNSVTSIGEGAFYGCSSLTSIIIPESVTTVGESILRNCSSLESITIPFVGQKSDATGVYNFGYIFGAYGNSQQDAYVPASLKKVVVAGGAIGNSAFLNCTNIENVILLDGVTNVDNAIFNGCSNLASVTIGNGITSLPEISLFDKCNNLTNISIGDGVTSITVGMFDGCTNLTTLTIGSGVTSINMRAFDNCKKIACVYYKGTEQDWANINKSWPQYTNLSKADRYYYSETQPTDEGNYWHYDVDGVTPIIWDKEKPV